LGLPVFFNNDFIGMVGIANKEGGYDEQIIEFLNPFLTTYGVIIQNIRLRREQQKYEEALKTAKELAENAVLSKEQFFTNISHELRTPLTLISAPISALISRGTDKYSKEQLNEILMLTQQNSNKLLNLIEEIMALAKLNSGVWTLHEQPVLLNGFFRNLYNAFKLQAEEYEIEYDYRFLADKRAMAMLDSTKLSKIVDNLISNALKYTPKGGYVKLNVFESKSEKGKRLNVEVEDNGVGVSPEDLPHIFDRFYQSKRQQQSSLLGSGVGLALAKELAVLMGGDIYVCSTPEKGSSFMFSLPLTESEMFLSDNIQDEEDENIVNEKPNILLVEDNLVMRQFISNVLAPYYNITPAENGAVAYALLNQKKDNIRLVLTDIMMPVMDGYELCSRIKKDLKGFDIPIIVLTARADEKDRLNMLSIGVDSYITKPFSVDELLANITNVLDNYYTRQAWKKGIEIIDEPEYNIEFENHDADTIYEESEPLDTDPEWIKRATEVIQENLDNTNFDVDDLARKMMVSKRQLYRFVKKNVGVTPLNFIREIRLQAARELLEGKNFKTLTEVCNNTGFQSLQHFNKMYFERFGKKPSDYK
jgi:signal transduction histidine kinase/DNA-binding response OmpR family regulator